MKDWILLKDYDCDCDWQELLLFSHSITNGEKDLIQDIIQEVKDTIDEWQIYDINEKLLETFKDLKIIDLNDSSSILYY